MQALWWEKKANDTVVCQLCFRQCQILKGTNGVCGVRCNTQGDHLESPWLGKFCSIAIDPIEKKPLYHWQPKTNILSLGSIGCTMQCLFCQNASIAHPQKEVPCKNVTPATLLHQCEADHLTSVAYTYNEPTLQAEYIITAAPLLKAKGIDSVIVSNGMFSSAVAQEFIKHIAAANIDLKTFSAKNYARLGGNLGRVLENITTLVRAGVHVEVTTLVVPGISDDAALFTQEVEWLASLTPEIPLHISRYFPAHKYNAPSTKIAVLEDFATIAKEKLAHVYLGNVR